MVRVFSIFLLILLAILIYKSDHFVYPIDEVEIISTTSNHSNEQLNGIINSLQGSDLLTLDLNILKNKILTDGWIKDVEIKKSFPSKLQIVIIPQEPIAIYNLQILMKDGSILEAKILPEDLAIIVDNTHKPLESLNTLILCKEMLMKIDLDIRKLEIHDSLVKIYTPSTVLISDRVNIEINLQRLIASFVNLQRLFDKDIKSIDMRYSNGFAIK